MNVVAISVSLFLMFTSQTKCLAGAIDPDRIVGHGQETSTVSARPKATPYDILKATFDSARKKTSGDETLQKKANQELEKFNKNGSVAAKCFTKGEPGRERQAVINLYAKSDAIPKGLSIDFDEETDMKDSRQVNNRWRLFRGARAVQLADHSAFYVGKLLEPDPDVTEGTDEEVARRANGPVNVLNREWMDLTWSETKGVMIVGNLRGYGPFVCR